MRPGGHRNDRSVDYRRAKSVSDVIISSALLQPKNSATSGFADACWPTREGAPRQNMDLDAKTELDLSKTASRRRVEYHIG